ncbi:WD repeat-containing protein slp1 [Savitreella phatthalungensis]
MSSSLFTPQKPAGSRSFAASPLTPRNLNLNLQFAQQQQGSRRSSPKSISKNARRTPFNLDKVTSEWTLTGTPQPQKRKKTFRQADRFMPRVNTANAKCQSSSGDYSAQVAEACGLAINQRILAFKPEAPESSKPVMLTTQYNKPLRPAVQAQKRKINTVPERVLDAPGIVDDYYLNLLDWSSSNCIAIALDKNVYVWNADSGSVNSLLECDESEYITSVRWAPDGAHLGVGLTDGTMAIYDAETGQKMRSLLGHQARVSSLSWNNHLLTSGSRSGHIHNSDVRIAKHHVSSFDKHVAEVCGLTWRADGQQLASGGNDNLVNIWDARSSIPKFTKTNHTAAVKALAWCPWNNSLLATGGGSTDKTIHMFSSTSGSRLATQVCASQVTSLTWSHSHREIVSTHGFPDNSISVFSYSAQNTISPIVTFEAHESRILHSALSPDGSTLATTSADENLKMWPILQPKRRQADAQKEMTGMTIR